jgi:uncharacterized protein with GYD domain
MPTYVSFFSYTGEAWGQMVSEPADRADAAQAAIEQAGGRMESFYWTLGHFDGFVVYTMPDAVAVAAYSAAVCASGRIARQETFQVLGRADAQEALERAGAVSHVYRPPGAPADWRVEYDALG